MPAYTCPHCQKPFNVPYSSSAARGHCPHCRQTVALPKTPASRWFYARAKKKYGPYTWQQLVSLAQNGELCADDMLLQEGAKQWVRAGSLPALFAGIAPPAKLASPTPTPAPAKPARRGFPWLIAALAGSAACLLLGMASAGYLYFTRAKPADPQVVDLAKKDGDKDPPKKNGNPPKQEVKNEDPKKPEELKLKTIPRPEWAAQFLDRLNGHRKSAGLGNVTLDDELSHGCLAHAKYLAKHVDPDKADAFNIYEEDSKKPGYSAEGAVAGQNAAIAFAEPLDALEQWIGRLAERAPLLSPELRSVGVGFAPTAASVWICVLDPVRGRGEPIVIFPTAKQTDVPLSFTGGPEVPDAKAAAGFPITLTFPAARQVKGVNFELRDQKNKLVEGWLWTPEKPVPTGRQHNTITLIPKGLLHSDALYQVKASAQVDGKPWTLAWSFTTEDDADSKGIWAKKALAKVNTYRAQAGLKLVELDDKLSRGCLAHARYLVINEGHPALEGLKAHDEDKSLPGFSEDGRAAGKASDIAAGDNEPIDGLNGWMATLYHRTPILEPGLKTIGFGCARGRRQGWVTVMNVSTGRTKEAHPGPVLYPVPDQTDVPLSFPSGGEEPNPIPDVKSNKAGFPITAYFPTGPAPKNATGTLSDAKGIEVPCWFSAPDKPANPKFPQNGVVCLIPKTPLAANTTYHVQMQGQLAGKAWEQKWKFTTGEGGLSVPAATHTVVDRLNHYRAQAGLNAVTLDEDYSFGCQRHAEYLAKNAEVLAKKNASVNDEDVNLPGFTRDGLKAAQNSDVFTDAPTPVTQIDDLMATFSRRVYLLDPSLQRIGFGCYHDIGRGWRCVLDLNRGRGDTRVVVFPAPTQDSVPTTGFDNIKAIQGKLGFPITVIFPPQTNLQKAQAVMTEGDKEVQFVLSTPEKPLNAKPQRGVIGVHPLEPLQAGRTYAVTVSVLVNGAEWRQTWRFTTAK